MTLRKLSDTNILCPSPKSSPNGVKIQKIAEDAPSDKLLVEDHFTEHFCDPEVDNLRIEKIQAMIYPQLLSEEYPMSTRAKDTVKRTRHHLSNIIHGRDDRLVVIVGPCSIHDTRAALEYASRLKNEVVNFSKDLLILMRVYFEKPRTTVGWKGLINDPDIDGSFKINKGLKLARNLLLDINDMEVPCGCEFLDTLTPQYIADLVSWGAIGARTTECQLHRELASALSMPVGFKNGTSGDIDIAVDAIVSSDHPHSFFSITKAGTVAIVHSKGNSDNHLILRGGSKGPNYYKKDVDEVVAKLGKTKMDQRRIIIDCSHGNSQKDFKKQGLVLDDICTQIINDTTSRAPAIGGMMIESHLFSGRQDVPSITPPGAQVLSCLRYGVSITDACVDWIETRSMFERLANAVQTRRRQNVK